MIPQGSYFHKMVKLHIPQALSVNSVKLEPGGGPGGAGGCHGEVRKETEVQLAESVLIQKAEVKKSRLEAKCMNILPTLFPLHIGLIYWKSRADDSHNILLTIYRYSVVMIMQLYLRGQAQ